MDESATRLTLPSGRGRKQHKWTYHEQAKVVIGMTDYQRGHNQQGGGGDGTIATKCLRLYTSGQRKE